MRTNDRSAWWYETDDGLLRISGHGENCAEVTVKVTSVGPRGDQETAEIKVSADDLRALMVAASQHMTSPKRGAHQ